MNLTNKTKNDLLFINFNQDFSCISVGTRQGYKIYNCEPFGKCYGKQVEGGVAILEMLFCTSLVALVGAGDHPSSSPRRLQLNNTKRQTIICELNFSSAILAVKLNRKRLVVLLEDKIHIYDISNMKSLHVMDIPVNPKGVLALSPSLENPFLAYPIGTAGKVNIFDAMTLQDVTFLQAHKNPVSCLAFSYDGTKLATASEKGTVIRVFSVTDGALLFQLRRGSYPATICSLTFNLTSTMLVASSTESETVHIFKLDSKPTRRSSMSTFLPDYLSGVLDASRDFAHLKLPTSGVQSICALSSNTPQVMVVTSEGNFYQYNIDLEMGGECVLLKHYSLMDSWDDSKNVDMHSTD